MACVSGIVYLKGEFVEGHLELSEDGVRFLDGPGEDALAEGIIIPKLVNCHTHLGDVFIPKPEGGTIREIVAPPNGLKHRMLRQVSEEEQVSAMHGTIVMMQRSGVSHFIDFREGGLEGAKRLLNASVGTNNKPVIFGRPEVQTYKDEEVASLLSVVDGIGVSGVAEWDPGELRELADRTQSAGKPFALHVSETAREDIDVILDLKPAFLIHMVEATDSDLELCASSGIPIVVCPTANSFFGIRAPVERMLKAGVEVCLGTDNAMLAPPDILAEMRALRNLVPEPDMAGPDLLRIGLDNGRKTLNSILGLGAEVGEYGEFLVLDGALEEPHERVLGATADNIHPISLQEFSGEMI
jgi:cytosine/adenosine deaminase-related metal-dependent hydrolase